MLIKKISLFQLLLSLPFLLISDGSLSANQKSGDKLSYPKAKKSDQVDVYHGVEIADPYRWLEEMNSPETRKWVDAQENLFEQYISKVPTQEDIKGRILEIQNVDRISRPRHRGGRYFFTKTKAGQSQGVIHVQENPNATSRVVLDPKTFFDDPELRLSGYSVSPNGKQLYFRATKDQSWWADAYIMEIESKKVWPEILTGVTSISWTQDGDGFFYVHYEVPEEGQEMQAERKNPGIFYHRLGTPQSEDKLIYARPDHPTWLMGTRVTHDGRYLIISIATGSTFTSVVDYVLYKDLKRDDGEIVELLGGDGAKYGFEGSEGTEFLFQTTRNAPKRRLIAVDIEHPQPENWTEVIPEREETLLTVSEIGDYLVVRYNRDALPVVKVFDRTGQFRYEVDLPAIALVGGFPDDRDTDEAFYQLFGLTEPGTIYKLNLATGKSTLFKRPAVPFRPEDFVIEQVFYHSKDGTRVPMFIAHRKGLAHGANTPVFMYAYGALAWSAMPWFQPEFIAWMEMGGIYAFPNIRGGGEYGEEWYKDGILHKKQNGIDDFIAAAEWLIENGYKSRAKFIANGQSASGVLAGAAIVQRPELFGGSLIAHPRLDMLRYHLFTGGTARVKELGSSDDPEQFQTLLSYSPYHNLQKNTCYPATLVLVGEKDEVTPPLHGYKFLARQQEFQACDKPVLLKMVRDSGHSYGMTSEQRAQTWADVWSFFIRALDLEVSGWQGTRGSN